MKYLRIDLYGLLMIIASKIIEKQGYYFDIYIDNQWV
jgi:hypothetical protein